MSERKLIMALIFVGAMAHADNPGAAEDQTERVAELFESSFAHEATGNIERSLEEVRSILIVNPNHYIANYRAAWLFCLKGHHTESIKFYRRASQLKPRAIEPRMAMMLPLMASKQWSAAEALGRDVLKKSPLNYLAGSRLAYIYFSQGRYKKAEQQYQKVLDDYPSELEMMLGLGWTYLKQGRKPESRAMFNEVLGIRRHNLNARAGLEALQKL